MEASNLIPDEQTGQFTKIPGNKRERAKLSKMFPGLQAAVARKLKVRAAAVNQVWHGRSASARVEKALLEEMNRRLSDIESAA